MYIVIYICIYTEEETKLLVFEWYLDDRNVSYCYSPFQTFIHTFSAIGIYVLLL